MQVLAEGVKRAGSLSASKVADAIRKLDIKTPLGEVQYQDNGDLRGGAEVHLPGQGRAVRAGGAVTRMKDEGR